MQTLTVAGAKGGVGKTTTSVALAAALAARGRRVALLDLDPQSSATLALNHDPTSDPWRAEPVALDFDGSLPSGVLRLYRAGRTLARSGPAEVEQLLSRVVGADVLIADCPPFLGALTIGALQVADLVVVPVEPAPMAIPGLGDVAEVLREMGEPDHHLRAVLVRVQSRRAVTGDVRETVEDSFPGVLYATEIPEDVRCTEAPAFGQPVTVYAPRSRAAEAYLELAAEVEKDLGKAVRRGR